MEKAFCGTGRCHLCAFGWRDFLSVPKYTVQQDVCLYVQLVSSTFHVSVVYPIVLPPVILFMCSSAEQARSKQQNVTAATASAKDIFNRQPKRSKGQGSEGGFRFECGSMQHVVYVD